ncbi:MAG: serine/threonine protein kinase [Planctomycetes bacterium]|nr:serine/threonine protein kinase [Planctomycetota bacterium]
MQPSAKPEAAVRLNEEKLGHALVSRGMITREEFDQCRGDDGDDSATALLNRLVKSGFLTIHQARRANKELADLMSQQIPGYDLLDKLGQGAMGLVWKARQVSMNRLVAIKVLKPKLAADPEFLKRFTREAHVAAKLSHNNVVQAIDVGSAGKIHYFVMEYVEGTTIKQEIEKGKIYDEKEAVEIVLQITQALAHASRRKLIHRDIKPANIIITAEGVAKLADLGLARDTTDEAAVKAEKGMTTGTPYYISPEQIQTRDDIDSRADIYSLGATFYHMVTGQPPFPGNKVEAILQAHLKKELTPPDHLNTGLSSGLGEVVECMMAKDRSQRYATPDDLIIDLECLLNGDPPKLARQRLEASSLADLQHGEEDEEDARTSRQDSVPLIWVLGLAGVLALSLVGNLILLMR